MFIGTKNILIPLLMLASLVLGLGMSPVYAKPRPPLVVSLQTDGEGQLHEITATVSAHAAFERVDARLELAEGATLESGSSSWRGPMQAGQQRQFRFVVRHSGSNLDTIRFIASGGHQDGDVHYRAQAGLVPVAGRKAKAALTEHRRIERQGRGVREYRLP